MFGLVGPACAVLLLGPPAAAQAPPSPTPTPQAAATAEREVRPAEAGTTQEAQRFTDTMVVTATRSERGVEALPVSVSVVSREEIEQAAPVQLDDILRAVPGLNLPNGTSETQYPSRNTISLRGLGEGRALVLLDGVPLNDPMFGNIDWHQVVGESVDRVEIVRGGSAALFGSAAMGGTVSIFSRPLVDGALAADVSYGSLDTRRGAVSYARRIATGITVGVDAAAGSSDGYNRIPEDLRRPADTRSPWEDRDARLRTEFELSPSASAFLTVGHSSYDLSLGTEISLAEKTSDTVAAGLRSGDALGGRLDASVFYQDHQFDFTNGRISSSGDSVSLASFIAGPSRLLGGSLVWARDLSGRVGQVVVGTDVRRMSADSNRKDYNAAGAVSSTQDSGGRQESAGAFAQLSWTPLERVEVLASLRFDHWRNYDGYNRLSSGATDDYAAKSTREVSPRLALRWDVGGGLGLRAAGYRAFSAPQLRQLYRYSSFRGQENLPNPALTPETSVGGEIGLDFAVPRVRGQLNVFENRVDDVISDVLVATQPAMRFQPQNLGTARSRGAEVMSEAYAGERWKLTASYTYADSETLRSPSNPGLEGKRVPYVPRNAATLGVVYRGRRGGVLSGRVVFVGEMFADAENLLPYDRHTLVDLFGSLPLGRSLEAYAAVTNAFDEVYLDDRTPTIRQGAPRQLRVGFRFRGTTRGVREPGSGS